MKFSWITILQGVEFSIFPIDFEWALQQRSATALPVIHSKQAIKRTQAYIHGILWSGYVHNAPRPIPRLTDGGGP